MQRETVSAECVAVAARPAVGEHPGGWRRGRGRRWAALALLCGLWALGGCDDDECLQCLDNDPPAVPTGVQSVTGDQRVTIWWNDIYQSDLVQYRVYRYDYGIMDWRRIGTVDWDENFDEVSGRHWFVDTDVVNGWTYDYAVTSVDARGNESLKSFEEVFDTPRPAGTARLYDDDTAPSLSGFDFSLAASTGRPDGRVPGGSEYADIVVFWYEGAPYVQAAVREAPAWVAIQDFGSVMDDDGYVNPDWLTYAPLYGYSVTGVLELVRGHAYVLYIEEDPDLPDVVGDAHFAKFVVSAIGQEDHSVTLIWAYQVDDGNRELKAAAPARPAASGSEVRAEIVRF